MIAVDANYLISLFDGHRFADGTDGHTLHIKAKSMYEEAKRLSVRLIIPYVCLAEYLEKVAKPEIILAELKKDRRFLISPFDAKATIEHVHLTQKHTQFRLFRQLRTRQGIKFDAQVIAISLANNAQVFCSTDADLLKVAGACGLDATNLNDIEIAEKFKQLQMSFPDVDEE